MSAVTFISIGSAVNISSTWASPWNTLARLTYLPIFQSVLVGIHYRQLGQGLEKLVQKAPAMFTVLHKPRHGTTWVAPLRSRLQSQWKCGSIMETPHPSGSGFTQHITSQSFYPAHELYGYPSVEVCSCCYTWLLMPKPSIMEKKTSISEK